MIFFFIDYLNVLFIVIWGTKLFHLQIFFGIKSNFSLLLLIEILSNKNLLKWICYKKITKKIISKLKEFKCTLLIRKWSEEFYWEKKVRIKLYILDEFIHYTLMKLYFDELIPTLYFDESNLVTWMVIFVGSRHMKGKQNNMSIL